MDLFDRFLQERTYIKGVSPETLRYYRWVRRAFSPILAEPSKRGMVACIQKVLATFSPEQVRALLSLKPKGRNQGRAHAICCVLLDTGLRISEALGIRR